MLHSGPVLLGRTQRATMGTTLVHLIELLRTLTGVGQQRQWAIIVMETYEATVNIYVQPMLRGSFLLFSGAAPVIATGT